MEEVKNTKKYKCRISEESIWWTINSIDKPDKRWFKLTYYERFKEVDFIPNFIDQFTISLAVDKATYSMVEITDLETNEVMYFLNSNISKKMDKGYVCQFDLDVFLTYAWDYFKWLGECFYIDTVHVNRAMYPYLWSEEVVNPDMDADTPSFPPTYKMLKNLITGQKDPLVNYEGGTPVIYSEKIKPQYKTFTVMKNLKSDGGATTQTKTFSTNIRTNIFYNSAGNTFKKPLCYVYENANGTYLCLVRLGRSAWSQIAIPYDKLDNNQKSTLDNGFNRDNPYNYYVTSLDSNYTGLGGKIPFLANKFVGCFEIPFINNIQDWFLWDGTYIDEKGASVRAFTDGVFCGFTILREGALQLGGYDSYEREEGTAQPVYEPRLNKKDVALSDRGAIGLHLAGQIIPFMLRYASIMNFNYNVDRGCVYFNYNYLTFDGNNFNIVGPSNTDNSFSSYLPGTTFNQLRGSINISTDSYNNYVAQTKIVQNTGLQIAKQQYNNSFIDMNLNTIGTMLNAMGGIGNDLYNKKVPTAAKMLTLGGIFSFASDTYQNIRNITQKYQNYVKIQAAANQTARINATANNIASSVVTDDSWIKMGLLPNETMDSDIRNRYGISFSLDFNRLQSDFFFLANFGFYLNYAVPLQQFFKMFTSDNIDLGYKGNGYIYIDFKLASNRYVKFWKPDANEALIQVLDTLNDNSYRIWRQGPDAELTTLKTGLETY